MNKRRVSILRALVLIGMTLSWSATRTYGRVESESRFCAENPNVERALRPLQLDRTLSFVDSTKRDLIVTELLRRHPDDLDLNIRFQNSQKYLSPTSRNAMVVHYKNRFEATEDPLSQFLYAYALIGIDTSKAKDLLVSIANKFPAFPWAHWGLGVIYWQGKYASQSGFFEELDKFFALCPGSMNRDIWGILLDQSTPTIAERYAAKLRSQLNTALSRDNFEMWQYLWELEFKAASPSDQNIVRERITLDLRQLDRNVGFADAAWLAFLKTGYTLADDKVAVNRVDGLIVKNYPTSVAAKRVWDQRWWKAHPSPKAEDLEDTKQNAYREELSFFREQLKIWPNDTVLVEEYFELVSKINTSSSDEVGAAADLLLARIKSNPEWAYAEIKIAKVFMERNIRLSEIPAMVDASVAVFWWALLSDNLTDEDRIRTREDILLKKLACAEILVDVSITLRNPALAETAVRSLGNDPPTTINAVSKFWEVKGKFAEVTARELDALVFYHAAISAKYSETQLVPQQLVEGESRVWRSLNGGEESRAVFDGRDDPSVREKWQKPQEQMLPWEISDLDGRIWKMDALKGKTVFINVWATWCPPCLEEQPTIQALYDRFKYRMDIQILTFNVDQDTWLVGPYMRENGYTFPVLFAANYFNKAMPGSEIPRNWIIDPSGLWLWQQIGFDPDQWLNETIRRIENATSRATTNR
jgi:thiol-disulfide isomerase/thioredoxin